MLCATPVREADRTAIASENLMKAHVAGNTSDVSQDLLRSIRYMIAYLRHASDFASVLPYPGDVERKVSAIVAVYLKLQSPIGRRRTNTEEMPKRIYG